MVGHHVGLAGTIHPRLRYHALLTYSCNCGTSTVCQDAECTTRGDGRIARRDRYAMHFTAEGALLTWPEGFSAYASVSADLGFFPTDRFGAALGLRWQGFVTPR